MFPYRASGERGKIHFGDEEERAQTEALAGAMLGSASLNTALIAKRITGISHMGTGQMLDSMTMEVSDLRIELDDGTVLRAGNAVFELSPVSARYAAATRAENVRQALDEPEAGALRAAGDAILGARGAGPELDESGDPIGVPKEDEAINLVEGEDFREE